MDAVGAGGSGDASPGHASLTRVTRSFQADFQPPWKANYDWLLAQTASPSFSAAVISLEACRARPGAADFLCRRFGCRKLLKEKGKLGRRDLFREGELGHESS